MYLYEVATESVCESAARLLFMSIKWAKSVPAFSTLPLSDQVHFTVMGWGRSFKQLGQILSCRAFFKLTIRGKYINYIRSWDFHRLYHMKIWTKHTYYVNTGVSIVLGFKKIQKGLTFSKSLLHCFKFNTKNPLIAADSVGGCLEGIICSGHRTVGNSCGLHYSSCCFWYVNKLIWIQAIYRPHELQIYMCDSCILSCVMTPYFFAGMNTENTESQRMNKIMSEIQALQEVVTRFRQMRLDATEFACLKCIVTFKAGKYC